MIVGDLILQAKNENKPLLTYIEQNGYDAITELGYSLNEKKYWPQFNDIYDIINIYPDVIYIMNKRDISKHVKSMKFFSIDEIIKQDNNLTDTIENIIDGYYQNIRTIMINLGRKFIEYDIETDNINKLSQYIDIKNFTEFPHKHKTINENYINSL